MSSDPRESDDRLRALACTFSVGAVFERLPQRRWPKESGFPAVTLFRDSLRSISANASIDSNVSTG